jgi:hypothetical protein
VVAMPVAHLRAVALAPSAATSDRRGVGDEMLRVRRRPMVRFGKFCALALEGFARVSVLRPVKQRQDHSDGSARQI